MKVKSTFRYFETVVFFFFFSPSLWDLKISDVQILEICMLIDIKILYLDSLKLVGNSMAYSGAGVLGQFS